MNFPVNLKSIYKYKTYLTHLRQKLYGTFEEFHRTAVGNPCITLYSHFTDRNIELYELLTYNINKKNCI